MKKFVANVIVKMKPTVKDVKGLTLKQAVESILPLDDLSCAVGSYYTLKFKAKDKAEAQNIIETAAKEILSNEVIETYEYELEEVDE